MICRITVISVTVVSLACDKCQGSYPGVIKLSPTHEVAVTVMQTVRKQDGWQMFIQGKGEKLMSENKTAENTKNQQSDNILEVSHLKKYFPIKGGMFGKQVGAVKAVDDVSFTLKRGTTMGLVGESGCGKSTTGRTILRLIEKQTDRFSSTEKMFTVFPIKMRDMRTKMQIIFQDPYSSLSPRLPVGEIIRGSCREA